MRLRQTCLVLGSGIMVYVGVAACSAASSMTDAEEKGGGAEKVAAPSSTPSTSNTTPKPSPTDPVPNAMADDWYKPGSRLKLRYYDGADGTKQFLGWRDSMRNEDCGFSKHADGTVRCMPAAQSTATYYHSGSPCTAANLLGAVLKAAPAPSYISRSENNGTRIFIAGAALTGQLYQNLGGCTPITTPETLDFYAVGAEVPAASFVQATEKVAP